MQDNCIATPHVSPNDHPIRRKVALAYRSTREGEGSDDAAMGFAMVAYYYEERPDAYADRVAPSHQVAFISSAINADPAWFRRNLKKGD